MRRVAAKVCVLALLAASAAAGDEVVPVRLSRECTVERKRKDRVGLERHTISLHMGDSIANGGLRLHYKGYADPKAGYAPVDRAWGDVILGCNLGPSRANGQWDRWHFVAAGVERAGKVRDPVRQDPIQGGYVLQMHPRGLADLVWRDPEGPGPGLSLRAMKLPDLPTWAFFEVCSVAAKDRLVSVSIGCYPASTSPQLAKLGRGRAVTTAKGQSDLGSAARRLDPAAECLVALHNVHLEEDWGCVLLFSPREVADARIAGTYNVRVELRPKPQVQALHFGCSYFAKEPFQRACQAVLPRAGELQARLDALDWSAPTVQRALTPLDRKDAADLLADDAIADKCRDAYDKAQAQIAAAAERCAEPSLTPVQRRAAEHAYAQALAQQRGVLDHMRRLWLEQLTKD